MILYGYSGEKFCLGHSWEFLLLKVEGLNKSLPECNLNPRINVTSDMQPSKKHITFFDFHDFTTKFSDWEGLLVNNDSICKEFVCG